MDKIDNTMNVKPTRADLNQGSHSSKAVSGTSGGSSSLDNIADTPGGSDTVTFTSTAAGMLKLEESLAKIPDINSARVTSIQTSIAEGTYQIDPEKIVANLLKLENDFR
jgi:negative regulator of flagellin synthesis FlgM